MTCANGECTDGKTCTGEIVSQCIDNDLVGCDQSTLTEASTDCGLVYPGGKCGNSGGMPACVPPGGGACAGGSGPYACQGSVLLGCANLLPGKLDCSKIVETCVDNTGVVDCVANTSACTRTSPDKCSSRSRRAAVDPRSSLRIRRCGSYGGASVEAALIVLTASTNSNEVDVVVYSDGGAVRTLTGRPAKASSSAP